METLLGMNLLFQALILIQIMRLSRLMLQQTKSIENGERKIVGAMVTGDNNTELEINNIQKLRECEVGIEKEDMQKNTWHVKQEEPEVLINEVLSEFF